MKFRKVVPNVGQNAFGILQIVSLLILPMLVGTGKAYALPIPDNVAAALAQRDEILKSSTLTWSDAFHAHYVPRPKLSSTQLQELERSWTKDQEQAGVRDPVRAQKIAHQNLVNTLRPLTSINKDTTLSVSSRAIPNFRCI